eukprot:scaffold26856_cov84-Amphora_coffeaeformis.AAC.1
MNIVTWLCFVLAPTHAWIPAISSQKTAYGFSTARQGPMMPTTSFYSTTYKTNADADADAGAFAQSSKFAWLMPAIPSSSSSGSNSSSPEKKKKKNVPPTQSLSFQPTLNSMSQIAVLPDDPCP